MKLRDFENIRKTELLFVLASGYLASNNFDINNIDMNLLCNILQDIYLIDILSSYRTATLTSDYKEMKELYGNIISNTANLIKDFNLKNPIEVFSFYVHLYRGGFLSHNGDFKYDFKLKDLPMLLGVDVVRGKGVCRNISSMLVDIYRELDFDSSNLVVGCTSKSIKNQQQLCDYPKKRAKETPEYIKKVMPVVEVLRVPDHMITKVVDDDHCYILDPTNDGMLHHNKEKNRFYVGNEDNVMYPITLINLYQKVLGTEKFDLIDSTDKSEITDEEYIDIYLKTLKLFKNNLKHIQEFSYSNRQLYEDLYNLSEEQRGLVGRMFPVVPKHKINIDKDALKNEVKKIVKKLG